jgi:MFS family permease
MRADSTGNEKVLSPVRTLETGLSTSYRRFVLGVLTLVYTLNFMDRGLVVLFLQPIKEDLHLSDTQLGFVTGIGFALFYAVLGVPVARIADRSNRVNLTSMAIGLWGLTLMTFMFVGNFVHLLLARIACAVGEAGAKPPSYSLVGDYFPGPAERARAMSIYFLGGPISALASYGLGGWLSDLYGWRTAFLLMGIPGILVALLVKLTVAETRGRTEVRAVEGRAGIPMTAVWRMLWSRRSTRHLSLAIVTYFVMPLGLVPWFGAFMSRSHGISTSETGVWLGLVFGVGGAVGAVLGGYVAGVLFSADERKQLLVSAGVMIGLVPCFAVFLLLPDKTGSLLAFSLIGIAFGYFSGPSFALLQRLVSNEMRATTMAMVMLAANLLGMGLGAQLVGVVSDLLAPSFGMSSLRYALLAVSLVALWPACHFWLARRTVKDDLAAVARGVSDV